jgi:hypothetical protein
MHSRFALTLAFALAGCASLPCTHGTVFVALTFSGGAELADTLDLAVSIDGAPAIHKQVARTPGADSDTLALRLRRRLSRGAGAHPHGDRALRRPGDRGRGRCVHCGGRM